MITIITPTYKRDPKIVQRAIGSVKAQTMSHWKMIVASDGIYEPQIAHLVREEGGFESEFVTPDQFQKSCQTNLTWTKPTPEECAQKQQETNHQWFPPQPPGHWIEYRVTKKRHNDYGASVRNEILMTVDTPYVCFFDDDNILMPEYCEKMTQALEQDVHAQFCISPCLHYGPLPSFYGRPPVVLSGLPPIMRHIDTIQCVFRSETMKKVGFIGLGYYADGHTYEHMGKNYPWIHIPETLSIHMRD